MPGNWNSGRRPASRSLTVLRGNPSKRPLKPQPPQPPPAPESFDAVPEELAGDEDAVKEWQRIVPPLRITGTITSVDRCALIAVCTMWSRYLEATRHIKQTGMLVPGKAGVPVRNPASKIAADSLQACQRLWTELGLTPSSRTRLTAVPSPKSKPSRWHGDL